MGYQPPDIKSMHPDDLRVWRMDKIRRCRERAFREAANTTGRVWDMMPERTLDGFIEPPTRPAIIWSDVHQKYRYARFEDEVTPLGKQVQAAKLRRAPARAHSQAPERGQAGNRQAGGR